MRRIAFIFLILLPLLAACGSRTALSPTPFPTAAATLTPGGTGPVVLTITELAAAPGLYRDAVVQLTGRLQKQPLLVCDTDPRLSPASWGLAEEGVLALAGGFDQQVRSLLPDDLLVTVEGRWRLWQGVVGCGKNAQPQEVWYLDVGRIVSPSPLTQVTLTPGSGAEGTVVADLPTTEGLPPTEEVVVFPTPGLDETPVAPEATGISVTFPAVTAAPTLAGASPTPTLPNAGLTPSTTATLSNLTGTPGGTLTGTPSGATTPTITGTPPTQTPTVTGTPPTQTPTATVGAPGQVVDKGDIFDVMFEYFVLSTLEAGTIHSWDIEAFEGDSMFIYAIAPPPADISLSLLKDGQTIINRQNTAPAGSPEFINLPTLPSGEGIYEVQVIVDGGGSTEYAITHNSDPDPEAPIVFNGMIVSGSPRSAVQMPPFATHYWFFVANAGDDLTLQLTPLNNGDSAVRVFGPDGEELAEQDDGGDGEEELLETTLPAGGLHVIEIQEISAETTVTYDLAITLQ